MKLRNLIKNLRRTNTIPNVDDLFIDYKYDFDPLNPVLENYRDLNEKVKAKTGYALLEVEPFPRYKIMKLCC